MRRCVPALLWLTVMFGCADDRPDEWEIRGRVVDEQGSAVDDFDAATFWSSNGVQWDDNGKAIQLTGAADFPKFWKEEGQIAPWPSQMANRQPDGHFRVDARGPRSSVFAVDRARQRGGYVSVERGNAGTPVTIKLAPLVRVHGTIYCAEEHCTPDWTMAVVHPPGDRENYLHFTHCGSLKGEFSFLLPPGVFDLAVYSESPDARMPKPHERNDAPRDMPPYLGGIRIDVPRNANSLDLGTLDVKVPLRPDGVNGGYWSYYGKQPPELAITDARGVSKDAKLADYRGRWVLIEFWTLGCGPCIRESLPKLAELYAKRADQRDRFEILAICNTRDDKVRTIGEYERREAAIVKDAWSGKPLPFPVLIDGEGKTSGAYGISGVPTVMLIDPDGNLVKGGGVKLLEEKLTEK